MRFTPAGTNPAAVTQRTRVVVNTVSNKVEITLRLDSAGVPQGEVEAEIGEAAWDFARHLLGDDPKHSLV